MGQMGFVTPRVEQLPAGAVERAYLAGLEEIPCRSRNALQGETLTLDRANSDSAHLTILWPVDDYGPVALRTASLIERPRPYLLSVELARGSLGRLRDRAFEGERAGMTLPPGFAERLRAATSQFIRAATSQAIRREACEAAHRCLALTLPAMDDLIAHFTRQTLANRHERETRFATLFGARLSGPPLNDEQTGLYQRAFNAASVPITWRSIETRQGVCAWSDIDAQLAWCKRQGLRVCAGPLLQLDPAGLPDWANLWDDDFATLNDYVCRFVEQVVERYRDSVHAWIGAARLDARCPLNLSEEQKLRLAVSAIETIRRQDPHKPLLLSFDQPWAEYMAHGDAQLSPLHLADALVRADLGIAGLGLELNLNYADGPLPRDILQIENRVRLWSSLGLPLLVLLTSPSNSADDPRAGKQPRPRGAAAPTGHTQETQRVLADRVVQLLLTKPAVQGLVWNEVRDAVPHEFAHGGLFDAEDRPKPVLETLTAIRRNHLV